MKNMKKTLISLLLVVISTSSVVAGGIYTNTNQSASFIRKPVQDAVIDATGTYYNPAGLAFLEDGLHFSISNQTISQTRTISSTFPGLNRSEFEGKVNAPFFPTVYGVYKTGKMAFSFGVNPIGGGGSAEFQHGLPSFEQQGAMLASGLNSQYSMDAVFDGSSLNWGMQVNGSYAINDMISASLGVRYVVANNSYSGHLKNISVNPSNPLNPAGSGNFIAAPVFFQGLALVAGNMHGGVLTLDQLVVAGAMEANMATALKRGLGDSYNENMTAAQVFGAYANITSDKQLDATQSGSGWVPVVGLNLNLTPDLNFAIKYEHQATITMTNHTISDDVGMYPDGAEVRADMPAMLATGLNYRIIPALQISSGFHYYFDKNANYGKAFPNDDIIDNNFWEAALGFEYTLNSNILLSVGYLRTQSGVNEKFQSDLSHNLSTNSIGIGGRYNINPNLGINAGVMNTMYDDFTKQFAGYNETYSRRALTIGLGLDIRL
jgi:long-chain fatty acid transport protein